jgi:acetamidase/formamidase
MGQDRSHTLGHEGFHTAWNNALPPRLMVASGETVIFSTLEPLGGGVARKIVSGEWVAQDAPAELLDVVRTSVRPEPTPTPANSHSGHALTGPVAIEGAEPGDTLLIDVISVAPSAWGWTSCGLGSGFLGDELDTRLLHVWDLRNGQTTIFAPGIEVPLAPFCGVMGVAPAESGWHSTIPPRTVGGNLDVRQLTAGATLSLPVQVPGALFSVGDAHVAQGEGEVAGTGIETDATVTLRFRLEKGAAITGPQFTTSTVNPIPGPWFAAARSAPDLETAARNALRGVLGYLEEHHGLTRPQACILASACVDLRISQVVNGGVFTVTAFLPLSIFAS